MLDFSANRPQEKKQSPFERKGAWDVGKAQPTPESQEATRRETLPADQKQEVYKQLRQEIDEMNKIPELQVEAQKNAKKLDTLGEEEKVEHLLILAREKGIPYAANVAMNMKDDFALDKFHDLLLEKDVRASISNQVAGSPAKKNGN